MGGWVLKLGAVFVRGILLICEPEQGTARARLSPRAGYEVKGGDLLISRANVVWYVGKELASTLLKTADPD